MCGGSNVYLEIINSIALSAYCLKSSDVWLELLKIIICLHPTVEAITLSKMKIMFYRHFCKIFIGKIILHKVFMLMLK